MKPYVLTQSAKDDLSEITRYLAETAGEEFAEDTLQDLIEAFRKLSEFPGMGHLRRDLTSRYLYFFLVHPYLIIYQRSTSPLLVIAILHSARDLRRIFRQRPL